MNASGGWIGVDLDGTLAEYHGSRRIGPPIIPMLNRVKAWLAIGQQVKIVTARAADPEAIPLIQDWLQQQGLPRLQVTDKKDFAMLELWDDRCVTVEFNTGKILVEDRKESSGLLDAKDLFGHPKRQKK